MKNIFTFTETNYQPSFYPGYVSINKHDDGQCSISVRQSGDTNGQSARIAVPAETLEHLASDIMAFFGAQDVDRPAPTSAGGMPASVQGVSEHETKCATCNGHGLVGGMMCWGDGEVDSIAEPCPDCQPAVPVQEPGLAEVVAKKTAEIEASGIKLWAYRPTDAQRYQRLRILGAAPGGSDNLERGTVLRFQSLDEYVDEDIAIRPSRGEAAQAAPSASGGYANGIEAAAKWVDQRRFDFEAENGGVDPETGALEFGTGAHALAKEEYDAELGEIADGIRSLAAATSAPSTPLPPPIFSQAHSDAMYRAGMILAGKIPQPSAPSASAPVEMETGWLVENGKQGDELRYRTMESGLPEWTADPNKAIRFARRVDAEWFSREDGVCAGLAQHAQQAGAHCKAGGEIDANERNTQTAYVPVKVGKPLGKLDA